MFMDSMFRNLDQLEEESNEHLINLEKLFACIVLAIFLVIGCCTEVRATTDAERNYCLQQSYDAQQIAENKLRGVPRDALLEFLGRLPPDSVPPGYIESNMLTVMEVYEMDFETAEEAQQKSLVKCLQWHEENGAEETVEWI